MDKSRLYSIPSINKELDMQKKQAKKEGETGEASSSSNEQQSSTLKTGASSDSKKYDSKKKFFSNYLDQLPAELLWNVHYAPYRMQQPVSATTKRKNSKLDNNSTGEVKRRSIRAVTAQKVEAEAEAEVKAENTESSSNNTKKRGRVNLSLSSSSFSCSSSASGSTLSSSSSSSAFPQSGLGRMDIGGAEASLMQDDSDEDFAFHDEEIVHEHSLQVIPSP